MTIFATCGHKTDAPIDLVVKRYSRDGTRVLSFGSYCSKCAAELAINDCVLDTFEEQNAWLMGEETEYVD